jgi:hypothetical protein
LGIFPTEGVGDGCNSETRWVPTEEEEEASKRREIRYFARGSGSVYTVLYGKHQLFRTIKPVPPLHRPSIAFAVLIAKLCSLLIARAI